MWCHDLPLRLEENGVLTDCSLKTQEPDETLDFNFSSANVVNKIITKVKLIQLYLSEWMLCQNCYSIFQLIFLVLKSTLMLLWSFIPVRMFERGIQWTRHDQWCVGNIDVSRKTLFPALYFWQCWQHSCEHASICHSLLNCVNLEFFLSVTSNSQIFQRIQTLWNLSNAAKHKPTGLSEVFQFYASMFMYPQNPDYNMSDNEFPLYGLSSNLGTRFPFWSPRWKP